MLELRNFPLWSALLRVECFVAEKSALETHTVITGALKILVPLAASTLMVL